MSHPKRIAGTDENWDSGKLGTDERYARAVSDPELDKRVDESLGLELVSVRVSKTVVDALRAEAQALGFVDHRLLIRDILTKFVNKG